MEQSEQGFIKVPIDVNTEKNSWFVYVAKGLGLTLRISKGNYIVEFDDPFDLYLLGCRMVEFTKEDFLTTNAAPNPYYRKIPDPPPRKRKTKDEESPF